METHVRGRYIVGLKISGMLCYCKIMYTVALVLDTCAYTSEDG